MIRRSRATTVGSTANVRNSLLNLIGFGGGLGHAIELWSLDDLIAVKSRVTIAEVVTINENDIGFVFHKVGRMCLEGSYRSRA